MNKLCPIRKNSLYLTDSSVYVQVVELGKTHFIYYDFSSYENYPSDSTLREFYRIMVLHGILCVKTKNQYKDFLRTKLNSVFKERKLCWFFNS